MQKKTAKGLIKISFSDKDFRQNGGAYEMIEAIKRYIPWKQRDYDPPLRRGSLFYWLDWNGTQCREATLYPINHVG
jgi:hypothetical protein